MSDDSKLEPDLLRCKYICTDCTSLEEMATALEEVAKDLREKHAAGWTLGGSVADDYAELLPPGYEYPDEDEDEDESVELAEAN
jgi:hypothetical protein